MAGWITAKDIYTDFFNRSAHDVRYWNEIVYGDFEPPWEKQWEIWESIVNNKRTSCRSGHGVGKSHIAARIAIWFLQTFYPSVVFTTAPNARQVKAVFAIRLPAMRTPIYISTRLQAISAVLSIKKGRKTQA